MRVTESERHGRVSLPGSAPSVGDDGVGHGMGPELALGVQLGHVLGHQLGLSLALPCVEHGPGPSGALVDQRPLHQPVALALQQPFVQRAHCPRMAPAFHARRTACHFLSSEKKKEPLDEKRSKTLFLAFPQKKIDLFERMQSCGAVSILASIKDVREMHVAAHQQIQPDVERWKGVKKYFTK